MPRPTLALESLQHPKCTNTHHAQTLAAQLSALRTRWKTPVRRRMISTGSDAVVTALECHGAWAIMVRFMSITLLLANAYWL
jgi:hypothetical protein